MTDKEIELSKAKDELIAMYEYRASILSHPMITTYSIPLKQKIASLTEQINESKEVRYSQTPLKYFESRNGGKSAESMMNDGEMITPIYAVQLISEYVLDCGLFVEPQAEQLEDKETSEDTLTRLQNGLFATGRFTIDKCIELSEGLITYLNEQWMSPSEQPEVTDEEIKNAAYEIIQVVNIIHYKQKFILVMVQKQCEMVRFPNFKRNNYNYGTADNKRSITYQRNVMRVCSVENCNQNVWGTDKKIPD